MNQKEDDSIIKMKREINSLRLQLEEVKNLSAIKERVLLAEIKEKEGIYKELAHKLENLRAKGYEISVLKALNEIIATASKYISLNEILDPTLRIIIKSLEALEEKGGREVKITGGIFLLHEDMDELLLSASCGVLPDSMGCKGKVAVGKCICGLAAGSGGVVVSPSCFADPRHTKIPSPLPEKDHAHVSIPLKSGDKVMGVIFLYFSPAGYEPLPSEIVIFSSIGNYLGVHIEKAQLYEKIEELATHDGLTGLYNHREFQQRLLQEVERSQRYGHAFTLMMLDIDYFKQFNDTHGHQAGDEALKTIGDIIRKYVRNVDMAVRYGGEEFAIILPDTQLKQAAEVAERLRSLVEGHLFRTGENAASLTISIGVASFPADANTGEGLLRAADEALYCAKNRGRNMVCLFPLSRSDDMNTKAT